MRFLETVVPYDRYGTQPDHALKEAPMKEFITAVNNQIEDDSPTEEESFVEFKMDGRVMRAYTPNEGQLTFIMAAMGRGQTTQDRYASIVNVMMEALRDDDADYFESRLLTRDPKRRLRIKEDIEPIFAYLTEEWFRASDEAGGEAGGGSQ